MEILVRLFCLRREKNDLAFFLITSVLVLYVRRILMLFLPSYTSLTTLSRDRSFSKDEYSLALMGYKTCIFVLSERLRLKPLA